MYRAMVVTDEELLLIEELSYNSFDTCTSALHCAIRPPGNACWKIHMCLIVGGACARQSTSQG